MKYIFIMLQASDHDSVYIPWYWGAFTAVKKNTYSDLPIGLEACHVGQAGM